MKRLLFSVLIFSSFQSYGQDNTLPIKKFQYLNSAQFELGGGGGAFSFNYEHIILNKLKFKTAAQFGISHLIYESNFSPVLRIEATEIMSFNKHHIEVGLGVTSYYLKPSTGTVGNWYTDIVPRAGYRYQKPNGRFLFRIGFTPFIDTKESSNQFQSWGGLSFGYTF